MMNIIFDLDGTLVDSGSSVYPLFREVIRHFPQYPQPSQEVIHKTLGNPDTVIWEMLLPQASKEERSAALRMYEELLHRDFQTEDFLIPGVKEMLETVKTNDNVLTIASNCGEDYLNLVLDTFNLRHFFTRPLCLESVAGEKKADILKEHLKYFSRVDTVMVGDRHTDVDAANVYGIPTIGCLFGFGDEQELSGAVTLIRHPGELPAALKRVFKDKPLS